MAPDEDRACHPRSCPVPAPPARAYAAT